MLNIKNGEWVKQCRLTETEGSSRQNGCLKKTWWDCVEDDMASFGVTRDNARDKGEWSWRMKIMAAIN